MATSTSFPALSQFSDAENIADVVNGVLSGKTNNTASVTITNSATTTVVADFRVGPETCILFMPTTSAAATELAAGGMYVSARSKNSFTITHSSATSSRIFTYVAVG